MAGAPSGARLIASWAMKGAVMDSVNLGVIYCEAKSDNTAAEGAIRDAKTLSGREDTA